MERKSRLCAAAIRKSKAYVFAEGIEHRLPIPARRLAVEREAGEPRTFGSGVHPPKFWRKRHENARRLLQSSADMHVRIAHADVLVDEGEHRGDVFQVFVECGKVV